MFSSGAAFANPVFEQACACSGPDINTNGSKEFSCVKCGLTKEEARALAHARQVEGPDGYFSSRAQDIERGGL